MKQGLGYTGNLVFVTVYLSRIGETPHEQQKMNITGTPEVD